MHYEVFLCIAFATTVVVMIAHCQYTAYYEKSTSIGVGASCALIFYSLLFVLHGETKDAPNDASIIDFHDDDDDSWFTLDGNRTSSLVVIGILMLLYCIGSSKRGIPWWHAVMMAGYFTFGVMWATDNIDDNDLNNKLFRVVGIFVGSLWLLHFCGGTAPPKKKDYTEIRLTVVDAPPPRPRPQLP